MKLLIESPRVNGEQIPEGLVRKKFEHFEKLFDRIEFCNIILRKEKSDDKNSFYIEARMKVPRSTLFSSHRGESFEITLDKVVNAMENQLRKHKEKLREAR